MNIDSKNRGSECEGEKEIDRAGDRLLYKCLIEIQSREIARVRQKDRDRKGNRERGRYIEREKDIGN